MADLDDELEELSSAEDFLSFFAVEFDSSVVHVNRLHILQRYHDYLRRVEGAMPEADEPRRELHKKLLTRAYQDFVESNALQEKVFKVFKDAAGQGFVSLSDVEGLNL